MREIKPRFGIGSAHFGQSMREVKNGLGKPEIVERNPASAVIWHYWSKMLTLHFPGEDQHRFESFEVSHPAANLYGLALIGEAEHTALKRLAEKDIVPSAVEHIGDTGMTQLTFTELAMNLWIQDGFVESIQCRVPLNPTGQCLWPKV